MADYEHNSTHMLHGGIYAMVTSNVALLGLAYVTLGVDPTVANIIRASMCHLFAMVVSLSTWVTCDGAAVTIDTGYVCHCPSSSAPPLMALDSMELQCKQGLLEPAKPFCGSYCVL